MEQQSTLFVKGMVCNRCVMVVKETLGDLGHEFSQVSLGEITISDAAALDKVQLQEKLAEHGFSLLEDRKMKTVNELKQLVAEVYSGDYDFPEKFRFSNLVKERWNKEYEAVRDVFIDKERKTLEQYIIEYRIGKVKELLVYSSLTLSEIAFKLNFTSVAHLSSQFKQQTGLTPSFFREIRKQKAEVVVSPVEI